MKRVNTVRKYFFVSFLLTKHSFVSSMHILIYRLSREGANGLFIWEIRNTRFNHTALLKASTTNLLQQLLGI